MIGVYLLGSAARVVWRYWLSKKDDPEISFDWRYLKGQIVLTVLGAGGILLGGDTVKTITDLAGGNIALELAPFIAVFMGGFGTGAVGRAGQKTYDVARKK
jgi:hypothetical protein